MMTIVPIIVVFTKFDDFASRLAEEGMRTGKSNQELAEREFKERYGRFFEAPIKNGLVPYTVVASTSTSCVPSATLTSPRSLAT
jgi:hypothetical protein